MSIARVGRTLFSDKSCARQTVYFSKGKKNRGVPHLSRPLRKSLP